MAHAADGADGVDGVSEHRMYPDDPRSGAAFTSEGNLDTESPQEGLRAAQAASERAWICRPAGTVPRNVVTSTIGARAQKIGSAAHP